MHCSAAWQRLPPHVARFIHPTRAKPYSDGSQDTIRMVPPLAITGRRSFPPGHSCSHMITVVFLRLLRTSGLAYPVVSEWKTQCSIIAWGRKSYPWGQLMLKALPIGGGGDGSSPPAQGRSCTHALRPTSSRKYNILVFCSFSETVVHPMILDASKPML